MMVLTVEVLRLAGESNGSRSDSDLDDSVLAPPMRWGDGISSGDSGRGGLVSDCRTSDSLMSMGTGGAGAGLLMTIIFDSPVFSYSSRLIMVEGGLLKL